MSSYPNYTLNLKKSEMFLKMFFKKSILVCRIEEQFCHKANNFPWKKKKEISDWWLKLPGKIPEPSGEGGLLSVRPLTLRRTLAGVGHVPCPLWAVVSSLHRFVRASGGITVRWRLPPHTTALHLHAPLLWFFTPALWKGRGTALGFQGPSTDSGPLAQKSDSWDARRSFPSPQEG